MSPLLIQWDRIRRRWVLVLVIALVAAAGSLGASLLQGTTYTGRAALTIVSQNRAPEQDTVLAQGYADYFNQPSSQEVLRQSAGVPSSVQLNARIAAASPIVYIEATAKDANLAANASSKMAVALRDDVNQGLSANTGRQAQDLQRQLAQAQAANNNDQVSQLQKQISNLQDNTNQLQDLQLNAGVAANSTNAGRNAAAALVGGLLFGALLTMALGRFENRIVTPSEVRDRLDLPVLAVLGGRRRSGEDARSQLLRSLMGLTNAYGMPTPGSLAVTGPYSSRASKSRVAVALAGLRALQGQTTLLVQTDLESDPIPSELSSMAGVADFLAERGGSRIDGKVYSNGRALLVAPPGSKREDLFALFSKSHVQRLLRQGSALADLVVVDAPPAEAVEGQVVCSAADRSLLVIEEGETRSRDATAALDALGHAAATAIGVVLVRNPGQMNDPGFLAEHNWTAVRPPAGPPFARPGPPPPPAPAPAPSAGAGQAPPADRTQPISQKKLEEAREALARDSGAGAGATAAGAGANGAPGKGANDRSAKSANAAPLDPALGAATSRRDEKPAGGPGEITASAPDRAGGKSATGGTPPSSGVPSGPKASAGPGARFTDRVPEGPDAKPSPRPKPADPPGSGSATNASSGPSSKPASPSNSPEGAKRVGAARFVRGPAPAVSAGSSDASEVEGEEGKAQDGPSSPTVTLRTEK